MKNNQFQYTYSAPTEAERREIEGIRNQYLPQEQYETALDRLRRLDAKVKNASSVPPLVCGVLGTLIFGLGLTCILEWMLPVLGVICGVLGAVAVAFAYPLFRLLQKKYKAKYGAEIVALSKRLLEEEEPQA